MSINEIELGFPVLVDFYGGSMVGIPKSNNNPKEKDAIISSLGQNEQHILVLVCNEGGAFLEDRHLSLLVKIISACELGLKDIALVNCFDKQITYELLTAQFKPVKVIIFGIDLTTLSFPLAFPRYQVQRYHSQTLLSLPSLSDISEDQVAKKSTWEALKKIFL